MFRQEYSLAETDTVAQKVLELSLTGSSIIGFKGDLGAGKTTFIQALGRLSGIPVPITSPTFALVNEYPYPKGFIYHFDLYRLVTVEETYAIGFLDYLDSGFPCWIEWYDLVVELLPADFWRIHIEHIDENRRLITIHNNK